MPPTHWSLRKHRPAIEVVLSTHPIRRSCRLIADTGAGTIHSALQLVLKKSDCLRSGALHIGESQLTGAYTGTFDVYLVEIQVPSLGFRDFVPAIGVARMPLSFDGIACFKFLNRFHYGNFGDPDSFGLE